MYLPMQEHDKDGNNSMELGVVGGRVSGDDGE
jgi:hypothetical protein